MAKQIPSPGRIVHVSVNRRTIPAIITHVHSENAVSLVAFDALTTAIGTCAQSLTSVMNNPSDDIHWFWPPRV